MPRYYRLEDGQATGLNRLAGLDPDTFAAAPQQDLITTLRDARDLADLIQAQPAQFNTAQQERDQANQTITTLREEITELTEEQENLQENAIRQRTEIDRLNRVIDMIQPLAAQPP